MDVSHPVVVYPDMVSHPVVVYPVVTIESKESLHMLIRPCLS